jgi:hypothetical protein
VCATNHCPARQRELCASRPELPLVGRPAIDAHLSRIGLSELPYAWDAATRTVHLQAPATAGDCNSLALAMGIRVKAIRSDKDHYWTGRDGQRPAHH